MAIEQLKNLGFIFKNLNSLVTDARTLEGEKEKEREKRERERERERKREKREKSGNGGGSWSVRDGGERCSRRRWRGRKGKRG